MAWAFVNQVKGMSAVDADTFTTASMDTSGSNFLVAVCHSGAAFTLSDSKTNSWSLAVELDQAQDVRIYYAFNATVGSGHTFTMTGTDIFGSIEVLAFSGGQTTDNKDQTNTEFNFGVSSIQPGPVTPTTDNQLVVTGLTLQSTVAPTINGGFSTPFGETSGDFGHINGHASYLIQTTATTADPTWSGNPGDNYYSVIATFKALSAVAPSPPAGGVALAGAAGFSRQVASNQILITPT